MEVPVFAFNLRSPPTLPSLGVDNYCAALSDIIDANNVTTIVLIDAGVDSVLRGDEEGIGTYGEDLLSILAVKKLLDTRGKAATGLPIDAYVMCVGLGTEVLLIS
jgi:hypothetical protein